MKKKIKALFLAIMLCITSFFSNIYSVSATVPGVVQAENVWLTLQTLAYTMGVNLPFIPDKSISYNNNQRKQDIINSIDQQLSDGVITQQQHDEALQQLDNMLVLPGEHGVGSAINIGSELWSTLKRYFYSNYISVSPDLVSGLSASNKAIFDAYSGTCAIYAICTQYGSSETILCVLSPLALSSPYKIGSYDSSLNFQNWVYAEGQYNQSFQLLTNNNSYRGVINGSGQSFARFSGEYISVQYIPNKAVNEVIITNDGENSLVSYPSYTDYVNGLDDVYSISNGQVVVTDTGEAPIVLDGDTLDDTIADINDGVLTWVDSIPQIYSNEDTGEIDQNTPVIGKKALDEMISGLKLERLESKFPFCIPNDLMLIMNGATSVSSNQAPVIEIPLRIEFNDYVYYDNDRAVVIDFNDFSGVVAIFREGFFLLFLIALLWVSIDILQAFFVVTE